MTIKITDDTVGLWFVTLPEPDGQVKQDWLGSIWKDEDGQLQMECRFRHYVDDKTFHSADKKNWYHVEIRDPDVDAAIKTIREIVNEFWKAFGGRRYEVLMGEGGVDALIRDWGKLPFNNVRFEKYQ